MVVLGLFSNLLPKWRPVHRHFAQFRIDERYGGTVSWVSSASGNCLLFVPASFLRLHGEHVVLMPRHRSNDIQVMIVAGGAFERGRILPSLIFGFCWATIVYCPLARWTWSEHRWLYNLPAIDFAGGGPVHIASGCSALAYAIVLGKRKQYGDPSLRKPHNTTLVFLGTVLIWTGWLGFNVRTPLHFRGLRSS